MKLHWLLPSTFGTIFLLSSPAWAAKLESWKFDRSQNKLEFNTSGAVQPQAQLIFNPTRLVIDLPNTQFGRSQVTQPVGGAIRAIRVGQFDQDTARIVVELASGYTLNPQQIKFTGVTTNRWQVQLPQPEVEQAGVSDNRNYNLATVETPTQPEFSPVATNTQGKTQIENLQTTGDGFFVRTTGDNPKISVIRSRDRATIFLDLANTTLSPRLIQGSLAVNKHGVSRIEFTQLQSNPPAVRLTLRVDQNSSDWRATLSSGGLVLLPTNRVVTLPDNNSNNDSYSPIRPVKNDSPATIQGVELAGNGTQLLIRADQDILATGAWDRTTGLYKITVPNAKLAPKVSGPKFDADSPVLRVRLQPQAPNTVLIYVQPAAGVRIGELNQLGNQLLALQLQRLRPVIPLPPTGQLPNPTNPQPVIRQPIPKGKVVVIIDPGHGGKDPGAVGIGGLQEKDIILPIGKRIAEILEQNGVQVIMTRNSDYFVSLPGRVEMAERARADVFVSIHANSAGAGRPDVSGLETYYYDNGLQLARIVHNKILQNLDVRDRGVRKARFYVLRKSSMPSILVETGFVTGREDAARLRTASYQNQMAEAIAQGILQYLRQR
ncbi:MAG TPA: N-acetylmuramoyl-L-alanine amidase [Nostocaceae cyanobacterium]|nr:N-acetylmuramoyl-L-alanine amidase [Nostocaceae cyanobacterium]